MELRVWKFENWNDSCQSFTTCEPYYYYKDAMMCILVGCSAGARKLVGGRSLKSALGEHLGCTLQVPRLETCKPRWKWRPGSSAQRSWAPFTSFEMRFCSGWRGHPCHRLLFIGFCAFSESITKSNHVCCSKEILIWCFLDACSLKKTLM
jgi:hypothetical protein